MDDTELYEVGEVVWWLDGAGRLQMGRVLSAKPILGRLPVKTTRRRIAYPRMILLRKISESFEEES